MTLDELKKNINILEYHMREKRDLVAFVKAINRSRNLTYLPTAGQGIYINTKALTELVEKEINWRESEITKIKDDIGVIE